MRWIWGVGLASALVASMGLALPAQSARSSTISVDGSCSAPAGNPAFGTLAWTLRDLKNVYCSTLRVRDQVTSPAFTLAFDSQAPGSYLSVLTRQLGQLDHFHGGLTTLVPGAEVADPYRTVSRWTSAGRGRVTPISFPASDGAVLRGFLFQPRANELRPAGGYPGVVITDGSLQGYQQVYFWAAEGLAEAGYMVMTYDVQGQGESDLLPSHGLTGVPFQQSYNFYQGAEDSLSYFAATPAHPYAGTYNPAFAALNHNKIGVAGHSLGAGAVSEVGQCDKRVKAVVAWDNLDAISGCGNETIAPANRSAKLLHAPALALTNDYFLTPAPMTTLPNAHAKDAGFRQVANAGLPAMEVALRAGTHLEYSYVPYVLPATELGERMAFYYTLAWFDYQLRGDRSGYARLVASRFDGSADAHSIGAGTFDLTSGNVPYSIAGMPVADAVSLYYESEYSLHNPSTDTVVTCRDMRASCPAVPPATP